ncbi:MAG: hypothetical protein JO023_15600 [Chloroflexi bacterium]|nr:hypothetical protein [Chloroflexota bacterium]
MHQLLEHPDRADTGDSRLAPRLGLACEPQLRVAAATLSRASADEIAATTVVGIIGADDLTSFECLVDELAGEFELEATTEIGVGSFSVRFTHRTAPAAEPPARRGIALWLAKHRLSRAPRLREEPTREPVIPTR